MTTYAVKIFLLELLSYAGFLVLILLTLLTFAGCGGDNQSNASKITGTWTSSSNDTFVFTNDGHFTHNSCSGDFELTDTNLTFEHGTCGQAQLAFQVCKATLADAQLCLDCDGNTACYAKVNS